MSGLRWQPLQSTAGESTWSWCPSASPNLRCWEHWCRILALFLYVNMPRPELQRFLALLVISCLMNLFIFEPLSLILHLIIGEPTLSEAWIDTVESHQSSFQLEQVLRTRLSRSSAALSLGLPGWHLEHWYPLGAALPASKDIQGLTQAQLESFGQHVRGPQAAFGRLCRGSCRHAFPMSGGRRCRFPFVCDVLVARASSPDPSRPKFNTAAVQ